MSTFNFTAVATVRATITATKAASRTLSLIDRLLAVREIAGDIAGLDRLCDAVVDAGDSVVALALINPASYMDVEYARAHARVGAEMGSILRSLKGSITFGQTMPEADKVKEVACTRIKARDAERSAKAKAESDARKVQKKRDDEELRKLFF